MAGPTNIGIMFRVLLIFGLAGVAVNAGGPPAPSCPDWEDDWYNYTQPGYNYAGEYEPLPNKTNLATFCPSSRGVLLVRCTSDYVVMFQGTLWLDDYTATCNLTDGLNCREGNDGCPDHAIQYGCDCNQKPISQPTSLPPLCSINGGSQITAPPSNNCSCPTGSNLRKSAASLPGVTSWAMMLCLTSLALS